MYFCSSFAENLIRKLFIDICKFVYDLIIFFFEVFERIGTAEFVTDEKIQGLFNKIGLLLGVFMVFRLSFAFIQYIINPDDMSDKTKGIGNVVKKVVTSVILLVTTPMLFRMAYRVQDILVEKQVVAKIILGGDSQNVIGKTESGSSSGTIFAGNLFFSFFRVSPNSSSDAPTQYKDMKNDYIYGRNNICSRDLPDYIFGNYLRARMYSAEHGGLFSDEEIVALANCEPTNSWVYRAGDFRNIQNKVNRPVQNVKLWEFNEDTPDYDYEIDAAGIAPLVIGIFALYIIITYTIQVGVRAIQLAYLQIIAPIPIMMYMTPKGNETLNKWVKQCTTTFFDFFIRCALLFFSIDIICIISDSFNNKLNDVWTGNVITDAYILVVLIIAVLLFAKKAPKLIQEIFPMAGGAAGFDYGLKNSYLKGAATLAGGMTAGAIGGIATGIKHGEGTKFGRVGGAVTGLFRGAAGGAKTKGNIFQNASKGMANQRAAMQRAYERNNDGSDFWGRTLFSTSAARQKDAYEKELQAYSNYDAVVKNLDTELEKDAYVQNAMAYKQRLLDGRAGGQTVTANEIQMADDAIKAAKRSALEAKLVSKDQKFVNLVNEAEAVRKDGVKEGYIGFGNAEIDINSPAAAVTAFYDNKDSTKQETYNIKSPGGGERHDKYKRAEANSKYNKSK